MLRNLLAALLVIGFAYGTASAKAICPDVDRQNAVEPKVTTSDLSRVRALTGLNPNRKLYNGQKQDRRRAYVSIHRFDTA